jgi:hypothetical protein
VWPSKRPRNGAIASSATPPSQEPNGDTASAAEWTALPSAPAAEPTAPPTAPAALPNQDPSGSVMESKKPNPESLHRLDAGADAYAMLHAVFGQDKRVAELVQAAQ